MAKRPSLGSRPVNLRAEPEPPARYLAPEDDEGDPVAEAALDAALAHLKSFRGGKPGPHFAKDFLGALDQLEQIIGEQDEWAGTKDRLRNAGRSKADMARQGLNEHLAWIDSTNLTDVERAQATLHAFSSRVDDLDPVEDRETIEAAQKMFAAVNPPTQDET
jgi:hypothetical protein